MGNPRVLEAPARQHRRLNFLVPHRPRQWRDNPYPARGDPNDPKREPKRDPKRDPDR